jgi:fructokinase
MKKLYAIGEYIIDFLDLGNHHFLAQPGGAPANVAVCVAQLGGASALLTTLGNDLFKNQLIDVLQAKKVDTSNIKIVNRPNMLAFVSLDDQGDRTFHFFQEKTANQYLNQEVINHILFDQDILHFCSVSLQNQNNRNVHLRAISSMQKANGIICFDPNLRFNLWKKPLELKSIVNDFLKYAHIVKLSQEELCFLTDESTESEAVKKIWHKDLHIIWVTKGKNGVSLYTRNHEAHMAGLSVKAIDTTGAGDAFIGAILYSIQKHHMNIVDFTFEKLIEITEFANKVAAHTTKRHGAISSYVFDCL